MLNLKKEFYYGNNSQFLEKIKIWWRHGIDWFIIWICLKAADCPPVYFAGTN